MKLAFALALLVACAAAGTIPELAGRITNGDQAKLGQFPYQVAVKLTVGGKQGFCGGTLVSNCHVLTAAHCTSDASSAEVTLGALNINKDEPSQKTVVVPKSGLWTHEGYDATTITNDIAIIRLPECVDFTEYIQPAVLPKKGESYSTYVGETVVASGWGKDSDAATAVSPVLNYIDSTVINPSVCKRFYFGMITPEMICISGKSGRSTCNGDSGGPLVHHENGKNVVIGATSFGIALGCEVGWPPVFTRVTSYLPWIESKLAQ